jgi:DNA-binding MarR family transcriptional regulator
MGSDQTQDFNRDCELMASSCALFAVRRLARAVTLHFDAHLATSGLRGTQLNLLVAIARAQGASLTSLGERLGMDRTALTHSLRPLKREGWVRDQATTDRRERAVVLTASGRRAVVRAIPMWRSAQRSIEAAHGALEWSAINRDMRRLSRQVRSSSR